MNPSTIVIYAINIAITTFVVGGLIWVDFLKDFT